MFLLCFKGLPLTVRAKLSAFAFSSWGNAFWLAFGAGSLVVLSGCADGGATDSTAKWSNEKLYAEAKDEAKSGAYDKAIPLFEKLEGRAAGTPLAQQAEIEKAYAQYKSGEPTQAVTTLDRFIRLHPSSPGMDYALYLKGVVNFNDNLGLFASIIQQDLSERDQKAAKDSFDAFKELVSRFPDSIYASDAKLRMNYIVNSLAQSEVHVARYYFTRGAYVAAINRAQYAVTEFPNVPATEEALSLMVKSYDALAMPQLRDDALRVLELNYPNSPYLTSLRPKKSAWWKIW
jgi:outer membrane protein assembly factor BamD